MSEPIVIERVRGRTVRFDRVTLEKHPNDANFVTVKAYPTGESNPSVAHAHRLTLLRSTERRERFTGFVGEHMEICYSDNGNVIQLIVFEASPLPAYLERKSWEEALKQLA